MNAPSSSTRLFVSPPSFEEICRFDLDGAVSRIRGFHESKPLAWSVNWYGAAAGFRDFVGLPQRFPIRCYGSHGIESYDLSQTDYERSANDAPWLVTRNSIRDNLRAHGREAYTIGSLFTHYRRARGITRTANAGYTLVFPAHSTEHATYDVDWESYIASLGALPDRFQPVVAVLYWWDVLQGRHVPFQRQGIPVVTCGHIYDSDFINKFYYFLSGANYVTSNEKGSYLFYSMEMDIPFFFFGERPSLLANEWREKRFKYAMEQSRKYMNIIYENCHMDMVQSAGVSEELRNHIWRMMGMHEVERREKLRSVALRAATVSSAAQIMRRATNKGVRIIRRIVNSKI